MRKYQKYPKYKDSGVEWIGEIPAHWTVWKVTHGFKTIGSGTTPKSDNPEYYEGNIPWITTSELRESKIVDTSQKVSKKALDDYSALKVHPAKSIAIAMYGATIGRLGILGIDAAVNQACCVFSHPKVFDPIFFYYWLQMRKPILLSLSTGGGQPNLSLDDLKQLRIPIPQLEEQRAIASFLDRKTAQIDELIAKKEALLKKLDEKRTTIITQAITKGLDPSVPMKDSGVEWIGEIPEHWTATKIRFYYDVQLGKMLQPEPKDESDIEVKYLKAQHVQWNKINHDDLPTMWATEKEIEKFTVSQGDLLICEGGEVGRSSLLNEINDVCIIQNALHRVRAKENSCVKYLQYFMQHVSNAQWFDILCNKATIAHLTGEKLAALEFPLPPLGEQQSIADFITQLTAKTDRQNAQITEAIERLKEYRIATINNAVSGKSLM